MDSRNHEGNISCDYETDEIDNHIVTVSSLWKSRDNLEAYMVSKLYKILKGAIQILCEDKDIIIRQSKL